MRWLVLLIPLLSLSLAEQHSSSSSSSFSSSRPTEEQLGVLQETVKVLMDFDQLPEEEHGDRPFSRTSQKAMHYMKKLYKEFAGVGSHADGNVVRSVAPFKDELEDGSEVIMFDIRDLKKADRVLRAELHMSVRGRHAPQATIICQHDSCENEDSLLVQTHRGGGSVVWDATLPIARAHARNNTRIALRFTRLDGKRTRPVQQIISRATPFLLVFARSNNVLDDRRIRRQVDLQQRRKRETGYFEYSGDATKSTTARVPDETKLREHLSQWREKGPLGLTTHKKRKMSHRKRMERLRKDPWYGFGVEEDEDVATTTPASDLDVFLLDGDENKQKLCGLSSLRIDFAEVGWRDWVIAPKSFEAGVCSGQCPFPLPPEVRPSNHALLQSVLGPQPASLPSAPAVCCAPERMDSLTLLYFDSHGGIAMKTFPQMVVSSCACL